MPKPSSFIKPIIVVEDGESWFFYYNKKVLAKVQKVWFFYKVDLVNTKLYSLTKPSAFKKVQNYFETSILPPNNPFITLSLPFSDLKKTLGRKKGL